MAQCCGNIRNEFSGISVDLFHKVRYIIYCEQNKKHLFCEVTLFLIISSGCGSFLYRMNTVELRAFWRIRLAWSPICVNQIHPQQTTKRTLNSKSDIARSSGILFNNTANRSISLSHCGLESSIYVNGEIYYTSICCGGRLTRNMQVLTLRDVWQLSAQPLTAKLNHSFAANTQIHY